MPQSIPEYLKSYFSGGSQFQYYYKYMNETSLRRSKKDIFMCLKGFASSTPIVNSAAFENDCVGGGFYFRYNNLGIAVDPGIGFIKQMHKYNLFINDINVVIVTHPHLDHNCDVASISSLCYDYNNFIKRRKSFFEKYFQYNFPASHKIKWILDEQTSNNCRDILDKQETLLMSDACNNVGLNLGNGVVLYTTQSHHIINNDHTYSLKFLFNSSNGVNNLMWGYTSDTTYGGKSDNLYAFFQGVSNLIFNISDFYKNDFVAKKQKSNHLGFSGSNELLKDINPSVALASEFCCSSGDYRYEIVKALRESSACKQIYPIDPGFSMAIDGSWISCSICGGKANIKSIRFARPKNEYGKICFICNECLQ